MSDEEPKPGRPNGPVPEESIVHYPVHDEVIGDPPLYDREDARRLLEEGDPLALEPDPRC